MTKMILQIMMMPDVGGGVDYINEIKKVCSRVVVSKLNRLL